MALTASIVITNHNYGRYLRASIDSALNQTYDPVEVFVVDDGSEDDSREVVAGYGDAITPIFKDNGGQASGFNAGFARSTSDIVIFLDADDVLLPTTVARAIEAFESGPEMSKVMYPMRLIDAEGRDMGVTKPAEHLPRRSGDLREQALWFPFDMVWMATSGNAFSAAKVSSIFPIPEGDYRVCADWYLACLSPLLGTVSFLHDPGALHRIHGQNSFEREVKGTDLDQVRALIFYCRVTARHIVEVADRLQLEPRPTAADDVLSVSEITKRVLSLKADEARHPVEGDTLSGLVRLGIKAAARRKDVSPLMRFMYVAWLLFTAAMPSWVTVKLSPFFSYPERRRPLNVILRMLHR